MDKPPNINLRPTFNKNAEFLCIEYPGVVANASKMLATLGGPENIEKVWSHSYVNNFMINCSLNVYMSLSVMFND